MRFLFVGGCERSGTSLVQKLLLAHRKIAGGPEFVFSGRIAELYRHMAADYPEPWSQRLATYFDREELASAFRRFYSGFFETLEAENPDALYISEKTPSNIWVAPLLLEIFPGSRFLHVLRDGRDVLASHRAVERRIEARGWAGHDRAAFERRRILARWNRSVAVHFELSRSKELRHRYQSLRFEDLVREPESELRSLFEALELDLEPQVLAPELLRAEEMGLVVDGLWSTEERDRKGFDITRIGHWRRELGMLDRVAATAAMAANLERLGYPVAGSAARASRVLDRLAPRRRRTIQRRVTG